MSEPETHERDLGNGWTQCVYQRWSMWAWEIVGHGVIIRPILIGGVTPWATRKQAAAACARKRRLLGL